MSAADLNTTRLHLLVDRFRAGDRDAADELIRAVLTRMDTLARDALRRSPVVRRWTEAEDVIQNALLRLQQGLRDVRPASTRSFFNLAGEMIRRELIDLARKLRGPTGLAANMESNAGRIDPAGRLITPLEPAAPLEPPDQLEQWEAFHDAIDCLDTETGEVFRLHYYHELDNVQIATILGVNEKTVRRRYRKACEALAPHLEKWLRERG
jgi:RNA polymerase sigma factor (sigma-70 family)